MLASAAICGYGLIAMLKSVVKEIFSQPRTSRANQQSPMLGCIAKVAAARPGRVSAA